MIPSEREVADVLDELHLMWVYEPRLFVLRTEDGAVKEGFRPDFYLPIYDVYIEVTKGKQPHATRKNRKARLARELYPGTCIELIYRAHFDDLKARILEIIEIARAPRDLYPEHVPGAASTAPDSSARESE